MKSGQHMLYSSTLSRSHAFHVPGESFSVLWHLLEMIEERKISIQCQVVSSLLLALGRSPLSVASANLIATGTVASARNSAQSCRAELLAKCADSLLCETWPGLGSSKKVAQMAMRVTLFKTSSGTCARRQALCKGLYRLRARDQGCESGRATARMLCAEANGRSASTLALCLSRIHVDC